MAEFNSCNWCGKVYRLKRGLMTGLVRNRKYCSKKCKLEAEGQFRFFYMNNPHKVLNVFKTSTLKRLTEKKKGEDVFVED